MCGIVAILDLRGSRGVDHELLRRMTDRLSHRGPDGSGLFVDGSVGLGHRRLAIIDVATGQQPLFNEDGSVVVVFNGEIYNYQELVPELEALGHTFHTRSDTEVIVHAWEAWGKRCVDRFRGMFAFALWDRNTRQLFLARDRLGVKPLYYATTEDGFLLVASELKAITIHPRFARRIDPMAVEDYFAYGYVPEPRTIYISAHKLPPAHTATISLGQTTVVAEEYWDPPFDRELSLSPEEARHELLARLTESVKLRMISEVPLGAFLSGGVDSSTVVALMAGLSTEPVNTCAIGFDRAEYDETEYAQRVATQYATRHRMQRVAADDFSLIDKLGGIYDEPYADSSALPTYRVCELARKEVTVALSGDGGDESFGGYRRYRFHMMEERVRSRMPHALRGPLFGALGALYPKADWAPRVLRAKSTFQALALDSVAAYFHTVSIVRDDLREQLFSSALKRDLSGYNAVDVMRRHAERAPVDHPLKLAQYLDMKTYLPGDINTKVDRASMVHSLETREPLMDHPLVEWLSRLPVQFKVQGNEGKVLLKQTMENHLPHDVLYRQKMGFSVPLASWFRGPLAARIEGALSTGRLVESGLFDSTTLKRMASDHIGGRRDYSAPIWCLLMFDSFLAQHDERATSPALETV